MTNKTKAAIEEAAKLPTAYQTLNYHLSRVGLTLATAHESILLDAIESHTAAHAASLRERVKELEEIIVGINSCQMVGITWPNELKQKVEKIWESAE